MTFVPFTAATRMSGVNVGGAQIRKGAADAVSRWLASSGGSLPAETASAVEAIARQGGTPLIVAERRDGTAKVYGAIHLKDLVKGGIRERFEQLRSLGIRTVMITGDNALTAAAIAAEAGVDDFLAEATPEDKLALIRREQDTGRLVAMTGDGTNDAPALAQADVGVAMNTRRPGRPRGRQHGGSRLQSDQAARDRRSRQTAADDPRLAHHLFHRQRRRQVLRHHPGDVRRGLSRSCGVLNIMHLASPHSAILSSVMFNALIIVALIPLALRGVPYRPAPAAVDSPAQSPGLRRGRPARARSWASS